MTRLIKIADWSGAKCGNVVFVHGLGGHVYDTWRRGADDATFWPLWLAEDIEGLTVYSLAYDAPSTNWLGTAMPLQDRARNVLECLLGEADLQNGPVAFVCHSLGGLIIKKVLLNLQQQAGRRPEAANFLDRVMRVVFAATPHTGSRQATLLEHLRFLAWPSSITGTLVANDPTLRDINVAYRGLAEERRATLSHRIFYETAGTSAGMIVDQGSADPGLPGDPPGPIEANHIDIVKPSDRDAQIYVQTRQFIAPAAGSASGAAQIHRCALPTVTSERPLNILPKLVRVLALVVVALIGFKGVQALVSPDQTAQLSEKDKQIDEQNRQLAEKDKQIDQILQALNEKRTTSAPPGSEATLRQAVTNVIEGASDPHYAEAVELLKAGKVTEAEPLLKAVAEEKERRSDAEAKAAAAAYRNLASIAAVSDHKMAREYYAKAARLDPTDIEAVLWNGWYQYAAGNLIGAEASYAKTEELARSSKEDNWAFWAKLGLGDVQSARGDLAGALQSYNDGLAIANRLAKSDPSTAGWQRNLSVSFDKVGDVQSVQGDLAGAVNSYNDGLAIRDRLAKSDPSNAGWQRDLSVSYERKGEVQSAQGDLVGALKSYNASHAIADRLAKSDPSNAGWQRDLSVSYEEVGDVQNASGDLAGALKSYNDGLTIADRLATTDPSNAEGQRDLSVSYQKVGNVQRAQGDLAGALKSYNDGLAIANRLAKSDPSNSGWQRDLSVSYEKVGYVQSAQGDLAGALKSYNDDVAIADRLAKSDPSNASWQRDLSVSFGMVGEVQSALGDLAGALKSYKDGFVIFDRLAKSDPSNADWQRDLSVSFNKVGDVQSAQGDLAGALKSYNDGVAIRDRLVKNYPSNASWQRDLSVSYERIGDVQSAQGDLVGALKSYNASLAIRDRLAKSDPSNAGWHHDLSGSYSRIATCLGRQGDKPGALNALRKGRDIMQSLTKVSPENVEWKHDLGWFEGEIARRGR
jgi:tetratricopeptide (TPR) repeat protein